MATAPTRTSLQNMIEVGEPALGHNFDMYFPTIPGMTDTRDITFKCQSTSIPGFQVETAKVEAHGISLPFAGGASFTQTWDVTFVESITWSVRNGMRNWKDRMRNWRTNKGLLSADYMTEPQIVLWNDEPSVVRTIQLHRVFLTAFNDQSVDGSNSATVVTAQATFAYTDHEDI